MTARPFLWLWISAVIAGYLWQFAPTILAIAGRLAPDLAG
jgi:hypothetical protein